MGTRGRKAPVELSVVPVVEIVPEPPERMSEAAKAAWAELFETVRPYQMAGALHLVECYCTSLALARMYAAEIERTPPGKIREELSRSWRATAASVNLFARSLRLTPRSRLDKRVTLKSTPGGRKPWELPADPPDAS